MRWIRLRSSHSTLRRVNLKGLRSSVKPVHAGIEANIFRKDKLNARLSLLHIAVTLDFAPGSRAYSLQYNQCPLMKKRPRRFNVKMGLPVGYGKSFHWFCKTSLRFIAWWGMHLWLVCWFDWMWTLGFYAIILSECFHCWSRKFNFSSTGLESQRSGLNVS